MPSARRLDRPALYLLSREAAAKVELIVRRVARDESPWPQACVSINALNDDTKALSIYGNREISMAHVTRRSFLLSTAALSIGCTMRRAGVDGGVAAPTARAPAVGQSWRYAKRDF